MSFIKEQLEKQGFVVGTFLDIEDTFNNTPHAVVCEKAARKDVLETIVKWIRGMLGWRVTTSSGMVRVSG